MMIDVDLLLHGYLRGLRHASGAASASLYVAGPPGSEWQPAVFHEGEAEPLPELADVESAASLVALPDAAPRRSRVPEGALIPLFEAPGRGEGGAAASESEPPRRRRPDRESGAPASPVAWLGLRLPAEEREGLDPLRAAADGWLPLLELGGRLSAYAARVSTVLTDRVSGLPDRAGFQLMLQDELEYARTSGKPLALLFVNPDGFSEVNERFGCEAGDRIIRDVSARLRGTLRRSEPIARFGGVVFAVFLRDCPLAAARTVAEKIARRLTEAAYLEGALRLGFSLGVAGCLPGAGELEKPLHLVRRADQALTAAKRSGGNAVVVWEQGTGPEETGTFDRMVGLFTGNMRKDYRNMVLLWETVTVIASSTDFRGLSTSVVDKLFQAFQPDLVALYGEVDGEPLRLVRGVQKGASSGSRELSSAALDGDKRALLERALKERSACEIRLKDEERTATTLCYAVPLVTGSVSLGCLYMEGREDSMALDPSDALLLKALGKQLAVALDRARLAELEEARRESEHRRLRAELKDLREALHRAKLVYRSEQMESLVSTTRVVAPTDATVLIVGESGTGKELLATTLHELSARRDKPMVLVDCGAITASLIESELFGHERGAFTGAEQSRTGRLAEAEGGTVFLDEIGELPVGVQSKLLRFVQEKQLTAVGGTQRRVVDVRIVAATNRDLAAEVAAGRFRQDLYHRLNVISLRIPPLRERAEDILHLAKYFLEGFSVQYQKNVHRFTPEAEEALLGYAWPGNVRELQNRIMQSVILCEGSVLGDRALGLPSAPEEAAAMVAPPREPGRRADPAGGEAPASALRSALARQIDSAHGERGSSPLPLGKWLEEDIVIEAHLAAGGSGRAGAALLGLPSTTFQRRWRQASANRKAGLSPRSRGWDEVRRAIAGFVRGGRNGERDLLATAEKLLLEEIVCRFPEDVRTASALLGVSVPTFRRRRELASEEASP